MTETSISKNTFNPDELKILERKNFEGFIKIVRTVGLPIYLNEVYSSDFSRIYAMLEAIRKLGKAAAGRFELTITDSPSLRGMGGTPRVQYDNNHWYTGNKAVRAYMAQIFADFPEISYYLTYGSAAFLPQFLTKTRKRYNEYWPADPFGDEYRKIEDMFYKAAKQYHNSLES